MDNLRIIFDLSAINYGTGEQGVVKRWMIEFETPPPFDSPCPLSSRI